MKHSTLPIAIIGGGPVGLAAAAHLVAKKQSFILFEAGTSIGHNVLSWGHVRVFSPWSYNIDSVAEKLLLKQGWQAPNKKALPTGEEIVKNYLLPLANLPQINPNIYLNTEVRQVYRKGLDKVKTWGRNAQPFILQIKQGDAYRVVEARAVIDASGTWHNANPIGAGGVEAIGEANLGKQVTYGIPDVLGKDKLRYANQSTLVVGGGYSAINSILDLHRLTSQYPDTQIHWILRKNKVDDVYGGKEKDSLVARGALGKRIARLVSAGKVKVHTSFYITEIKKQSHGKLQIFGLQEKVVKTLHGIDQVIGNTGARPDFSFLRETRYTIDPSLESVAALAPLIDPNIHSCGTVRPHGEAELRQPEKDFYIVGAKSYGRAPTFLMTTGYEQVRSIVAALTGDYEAAQRVELVLPETGVCSSQVSEGENTSCNAADNGKPNIGEAITGGC